MVTSRIEELVLPKLLKRSLLGAGAVLEDRFEIHIKDLEDR